MKIVSVLCVVGASALLVPASLGQMDAVAEELVQRLTASWPSQGALLVEYRNDPGGQEIQGYDFASGAWYIDRRHGNAVSNVIGVDPDGRAYMGTMPGKRIFENPEYGFSSRLDGSFPGVYLKAVLEWPGALQDAVELPDGGWELIFSLPRGNRSLSIKDLPEPELERWGGLEKVNRIVTVRVDKDLQVLSIKRPDLVIREFERADCSPGGFQVSQHWPAPSQKFILTRCEFSESPGTAAFAADEVIRRGTDRRISVRQRTPVPSLDPEGPRPVPIRDDRRTKIGLRPSVLLWGGVLVAGLGVLAWLRRRQA